ncbi:Kelch domain-containing protein 10 [Thelohanellus kitauei]|uniref:Kelch domain-containing protein 10 n=1 Tax=Thelohanellus kitauei TaxID=669202 RepID=A0A0C2NHF9_THEKT|nr:Kelch domain-containing protein 10 [Thelohanellus kitauei]
MDRWNVQAELKNRSGHCMTTFGEFLIIYGGRCHSSGTLFNELWTYNSIHGSWRQYQAPTETSTTCVFSSICTSESSVYIFGGRGYSLYDRATNLLLSFDVISGKWRTLSPEVDDHGVNSPPPLYGSGLFYHNGSLYVLGGIRSNMVVYTMYKFCLTSSTWSLVIQNEPKPCLDCRIFGTVFKNQLYIFGGPSSFEKNKYENVKVYDFSTSAWTTRTANSKDQLAPCLRMYESYAFFGNYGYLSGGKDLSGYNSEIWRIDLETLKWLKLDYTLQTGLIFNCIAVVSGCYLYSYGGIGEHKEAPNKLYRFILQPPTLYRLSQESFCRSLTSKAYLKLLPPSIQDDLKFDIKN